MLKVSGWFGVVVRKYDANKNVKLELFISGASGQIDYNEKSGRLTIPADSSYAIAVGATDWSDDSLHYYSSRGPTTDNRIKPDFSEPSETLVPHMGIWDFMELQHQLPMSLVHSRY